MKKKAPSFKKEAHSFFKFVTPNDCIFVFDRKRIERKECPLAPSADRFRKEASTQNASAGHHEKKSIGALFQSEDKS